MELHARTSSKHTTIWNCMHEFKPHRYMELYAQVQSAPLHGTVCTSSKRTTTYGTVCMSSKRTATWNTSSKRTATWNCMHALVQRSPLHGTVCTSSKCIVTWNCMYKFKVYHYTGRCCDEVDFGSAHDQE